MKEFYYFIICITKLKSSITLNLALNIFFIFFIKKKKFSKLKLLGIYFSSKKKFSFLFQIQCINEFFEFEYPKLHHPNNLK